MRITKLLTTAGAALAVTTAAGASPVPVPATTTFDITWSGAAFGDNATATGYITVDSTLPAITPDYSGNDVFLPSSDVTALSITITGAGSGNGTFGLSDFFDITFWSPAPLNTGEQLVGQDLGNGCTYGSFAFSPCGGLGGDFNLFTSNPLAPDGYIYFTLATDGGSGDLLAVTSITPAGVPEPAAWATMLLGLGMVGGAFRLRREARALAA
jgi:hypothetical protein